MLFHWIPIMCILVLPSAIAIRAIMAINSHKWPLWHLWQQLWQHQYAHYGYPVKEHRKTDSAVLFSAQCDNPFISYDCLTSCCWSLECSLYCKNGRLRSKSTDMGRKQPRAKTNPVLESVKQKDNNDSMGN